MSFSTALMVSALVLSGPGDANPDRGSSNTVQVKHCLVSMIDHVRLSASTAGPLATRPLEEGTVVTKGDILAQLDDSEAQIKREAAEAEMIVAKEQAESNANIEAAEKMAKVAEAEYQQALEINRKSPGAISETEVRRLRLTWERGVLQAEVARLEKSVAGKTVIAKQAAVKAAENEIRLRKIVAPMDAIIDHVMASEGEWVQPGQPVFELVRVDRLRVEAFLNATEISPHEVEGQPVVIEIQVRDPKTKQLRYEKFESKITFVSRQVVSDGAYRIATDFDNRKYGNSWAVSPGLTANMTIKLAGDVEPAAAPAAAAAPKPFSRFTPAK